MVDFFTQLFDDTDFPPRWRCGVWSETLGWTHIVSDVAIFGAYTAIPIVLAFFTFRRRDIPFPGVIWLFVTFIFACGATHLIEAIIFWKPVYRFAGSVKAFTAVVSWGTVIALIKVVPQVIHFPGLAKLNDELSLEIQQRRQAEAELRRSEQELERLLRSERQALTESERASRIKDEFLSTVSHELRTPLNAILGYSQLLLRAKDGGDLHEGLSVIERNARAQARIIEDLLDMSRVISGKMRLEATTIDPAQAVTAAIETIQPTAAAKGVGIHSQLAPGAGPIVADANRIQQIVWNLLSNAVKFTPAGGRIEVSLQQADAYVEIRVSDSGQGIKPEFLPFVFDRFRQEDPGTTRRHGGLGLGLSVVKQLVELHGGTVRAYSEGESRGATFVVTLPVHFDPQQQVDAPSEFAASDWGLGPDFSLKGVRVLVVDDEPDARELVNRLLTDWDADVELASSVDEALVAFRRRPPDVLLSDVGMPDKDGFDLARAIRRFPEQAGGRVPAAAVTAFASSEDRRRALLAGYQAHVSKPINPAELAAVVATLTGRTGAG